jgi:hypothetical protein
VKKLILAAVLGRLILLSVTDAKEASAQDNGPLLRPSKDGLLTLTPGQSVDITSERLLLTFRDDRFKDKRWFNLLIGGRSEAATAGKRIDLRHFSPGLRTKKACFLDVVDYKLPQDGGRVTATFRLNCG